MARKFPASTTRNLSKKPAPCQRPHAHETLLQDGGFDGFETSALHVMRHVCLTMSPKTPRAGDPFGAAEEMFGGIEGAHIGAALTALVQTMAMGRSAQFQFSNPTCRNCAAVLTECERHLLTVLRAVRRGHLGTATAHAAMLCDRAPAAALVSAASQVAAQGPRLVRML